MNAVTSAPFSITVSKATCRSRVIPPNHKQGGLLSKDIEGIIRRETAVSSVLLDSIVKPSLFLHTEMFIVILWQERGIMPEREICGIKDMVCLTQRCLEMITKQIHHERKTKFQRRCLHGGKTTGRIP